MVFVCTLTAICRTGFCYFSINTPTYVECSRAHFCPIDSQTVSLSLAYDPSYKIPLRLPDWEFHCKGFAGCNTKHCTFMYNGIEHFILVKGDRCRAHEIPLLLNQNLYVVRRFSLSPYSYVQLISLFMYFIPEYSRLETTEWD